MNTPDACLSYYKVSTCSAIVAISDAYFTMSMLFRRWDKAWQPWDITVTTRAYQVVQQQHKVEHGRGEEEGWGNVANCNSSRLQEVMTATLCGNRSGILQMHNYGTKHSTHAW